MLFPIFIVKEKSSDYGVVVPGLPGCYSAGRSLDEAMSNAREAIELHLEGIVEDGMEIPEQGTVDDYMGQIRAGGIPAVVEVDTSAYESRQSERVNVTFPKALLRKIDKASERLGTTRSGLLQRAASAFVRDAVTGNKMVASRMATPHTVVGTAKKTSVEKTLERRGKRQGKV